MLDSIIADPFAEFYPNRKQIWKEKMNIGLRVPSEVNVSFFKLIFTNLTTIQ